MSTQENKESGFFEGLLMVAGGISGAIFGYNVADVIGLLVGAVVFWCYRQRGWSNC